MSPRPPDHPRRRPRPEADDGVEGDKTLDYFEADEPWRPDSRIPMPDVEPEGGRVADGASARPRPPPDGDALADYEAGPAALPSRAQSAAPPPALFPDTVASSDPLAEGSTGTPSFPGIESPAPDPGVPVARRSAAQRGASMDPAKVLPRGWKFLGSVDQGVIGAMWTTREPGAGFLRTLKVLGRAEQIGAIVPAGEAGDALKPYLLPWQKNAIRATSAYLVVSARAAPTHAFLPQGEQALSQLHAIAVALARFHKHRHSMNFLVPRGIAIEESERGPKPIFVDFGLSIRATMDDIERGRLSCPSVVPGTVAYWAPEVVRRLDLHKPASGFHPQADVWFLAVATVEVLWGRLPWDTETWTGALAGHVHLAEAIDALDLGDSCTRLLKACVDPDPSKRLGVQNFVAMLQVPARRARLWSKHRVAGGVLDGSFGGRVPALGPPGTGSVQVARPTSPLDETLLDPFTGAGDTRLKVPSRKEMRKLRRAQRMEARLDGLPRAGPRPRLGLRTAAWSSMAAAAALTLVLASGSSALFRRSPGLAASLGIAIQWPDLRSERDALAREQELLLGHSTAEDARNRMDALADVADMARECEQIWVEAVPRWRDQLGVRTDALGANIQSFAQRVGACASATRAERGPAGVDEAPQNARLRAHAARVRDFNARQAARVASAQAAGQEVSLVATQPLWVPTRLLEQAGATSVNRAAARARLLLGIVAGGSAARREEARKLFSEARAMDGDLVEALLEDARSTALSGQSFDKSRLGKELEEGFQAFSARHFRSGVKHSPRIERVGALYREVRSLLQ